MRDAGIEGEVHATVVVDSTGRVDESSVTIVKASTALFEEAVRRVIGGPRFLPAERGGRPTAQQVQLDYQFRLQGGAEAESTAEPVKNVPLYKVVITAVRPIK
jgi:TonB family protein